MTSTKGAGDRAGRQDPFGLAAQIDLSCKSRRTRAGITLPRKDSRLSASVQWETAWPCWRPPRRVAQIRRASRRRRRRRQVRQQRRRGGTAHDAREARRRRQAARRRPACEVAWTHTLDWFGRKHDHGMLLLELRVRRSCPKTRAPREDCAWLTERMPGGALEDGAAFDARLQDVADGMRTGRSDAACAPPRRRSWRHRLRPRRRQGRQRR